MAKGRWTIVVVPQGSSKSKVVEISHTALKLLATLGVAFAILTLLIGYATVSRSLHLAKSDALRSENARLAEALGQLHGRLSVLTDTIALIEKRDARIRLLANLEPIDPEVRGVGIGGPRAPGDSSGGKSESVLVSRTDEVTVDLSALIRRADLLANSFSQAAESLSAHADRTTATPSIMPTQGWLSSEFSRMREHPILHIARPHEGIDVTAPMGASIEAPAAGKIIETGWEAGYGNTVVIDHGFGVHTKFAHISRTLVHVGQRVARGARIALVGNTGLSTGPHLHYEVHVNGRPVDPLHYILPGVITD